MPASVMKSLVKPAVIVGLVSAAALAASAVPASAASEVVLKDPATYETLNCTVGSYGIQAGLDEYGVTTVDNGCGNRVWLHEFADGSGWAICITGHSDQSIPGEYQFPHNVVISGNTSYCSPP